MQINTILLKRAIMLYITGLLFTGLIIFLPAGTLKYWNGWLYIGALFVPMFFVMVFLLVKDPELLAKRMKAKEREKTQKIYLFFSLAVFVITFILPGMDFRFHWSTVPLWLVMLSTVVMFTGYVMFFVVMKQNTYASRVVEIQKNQKLIDTGLYAVVRHPMYLAAIILYAFSPLVLGSYIALIPMLFIPVLLILRINNEEKVLSTGLEGYNAYKKKVKYKLIPYIW